MAAFSDYLENKLLDHALGVAAFTAPGTVYLAAFTSNPTDAGTGAEVSGGSYARQAVTFGAASGGATENSATVTFPQATASWGTVTHLGIFDAASAGNLLVHAPLTTARAIDTDDVLEVLAGDLDVSLD